MLGLLNNADFFSQYGLLIVLVVALVVLMLISFNRRKKEDAHRADLNQKVVPGSLVKTYYGLYGKVIKVTETTDGKIILIATGEGDKVSYQSLHINAIYAMDEKENVTLDKDGNIIEPNEEVANEKNDDKVMEDLREKLESFDKKDEQPKAKTAKTKTDAAEDKTASTTDSKKSSTKSTKATTKK